MAGKPPDYNVSAIVRDTDIKGNIGVAWKSDKDDGRISIKLHGFVHLVASPDLYITLFPRDADEGRSRSSTTKSSSRRPARRAAGDNSDMDDDIPF
jgi:hypothetical protein